MGEFHYQLDRELILIPVTLTGRSRTDSALFVFDTGASGILLDHELAEFLGYSAKDAIGFSTVSSAVGKERGYRLQLECIEAIGHRAPSIEVACHDLKEQGIDGLLGMTFLNRFRWCVHPDRQVIVV